MKRFWLILTAVPLLLILTGPAYAQSPVGKWVDSRLNVTLVLNGDFTYSLTFPNGRSRGQWSGGGNQFCLRDASAPTPVCYTVVSYSASVMTLRDGNGVMIHYKKVGPKSVDRRPAIRHPEKVVAVKGDFSLTSVHLKTGIDLTQFIAGRKISENEVSALRRKMVEEFNAAPAEMLRQLNGIGKSMERVYRSTDPYRIGLVRQELFATFYKLTRKMEESQKPLMIQVINRYVQVLAYDEQNNLLLTRRDVEGYLNYLVFNSELAGRRIDANYAVRRAVTRQLVENFNAMPMERKRMLACASLIWRLLESNWKRLDDTQKSRYIQAYRNQISSRFVQNTTGSGSIPKWKPPQGAHKKSLSQMRREFNAKQNMFRMMQNMNTSSHALSLNIIENVGGTGNYWKVTDY